MSYAFHRCKQMRPDLYKRLTDALQRIAGDSPPRSFKRMIVGIRWEEVLRRKLKIPKEWP